MRNERNRPQYNNCETYELKKKTTANELYRRFDELKAKFRNKVETMVYMMTSMAMLAMTMMVDMVLRVEQRQCDH